MLATLVGTKDGAPACVGDLVQVEVPPNCVVCADSPVTARDVALSWFMAGRQCGGGDTIPSMAEAMFDALWNAAGIGGLIR